MKKNSKLTDKQYLDEIDSWQQSAKIHADNAIAQYKKVTEGLEKFYFEKNRNEAILGYLSDAVIVFDDQKEIIVFNKKAEKLLSISSSKVLGKNFDEVCSRLNKQIFEFVSHKKVKKTSDQDDHIIRINDEFLRCRFDRITIRDRNYFLVLLEENTDLILTQHELQKEKNLLEQRVKARTIQLEHEIHEKELAKKKAEDLSLSDSLTALPNRRAFLAELDAALARNQRDINHSFSLLFIDLDGFKTINDILGHYAGDIVLIEISKRLSGLIRANDFCSRLGGDEFVILLDNLNTREQAVAIVNKMLACISAPISFNNQVMAVSASVGIYLHTDYYDDASSVLTMADEAMYEAKARGKDCFVFFNHDLHRRVRENTSLIQMLNHAMANKEFDIYFQPICDIDGLIIGAETLARWIHDGEMIAPEKFIPLLEQRGSIKEFTNFVIEKVLETLKCNPSFPHVSINLSIKQFYSNDFIDYLDDLFKGYQELQSRISFEITESLFHEDPKVLLKGIKALRARGFRISIDDFGTGYSSFSYIRNFTADIIKIDRAFVIDIEKNEKNYDLLKGMVALLQSMGSDVVIEGVENREQIEKIKRFSTNVKIQGNYFHYPMPLVNLLVAIDRQNVVTDWNLKKDDNNELVNYFLKTKSHNRNLMKALLDELTTFVGVLSPAGKILYINNTSMKLTGTPFEEIEGRSFQDISWWSQSKKDQSKIKSDVKACALGQRTLREIQLKTVSHGSVWIEFSMHPIVNEDGEIVYLIPEGRNIDRHKKDSSILRQSLNVMQTFVGILQKDGSVCFINSSALKSANIDEDDVISKKFWECNWFTFNENTSLKIKSICSDAALGKKVSENIVTLIENKQANIKLNIQPITDEKGKVIRLVAEGRLLNYIEAD